MASLLVVGDLDGYATSFVDFFNDLVPLSEENMDDMQRLDCFLNLLSLRFLKALPEDEFKPGGGGEGGVKTSSFTDTSSSCFTILAAYRAMGAMAVMSFAIAKVSFTNDLGAATVSFIASLNHSLIPDESSKRTLTIHLKRFLVKPRKKRCCDSRHKFPSHQLLHVRQC